MKKDVGHFKSAGARAQPKNNFIVHLSQNVREQRRSGGVGAGGEGGGGGVSIESHREVPRVQVRVNMDLCVYIFGSADVGVMQR